MAGCMRYLVVPFLMDMIVNSAEPYNITLGAIIEDVHEEIFQSQSRCWHPDQVEQMSIWVETVYFRRQNLTSLRKQAAILHSSAVDIVIGHASYFETVYLSKMFHTETFGVQNIHRDKYWFLANAKEPHCCEEHEDIFQGDYAPMFEAITLLSDLIKNIDWKNIYLLYEMKYVTHASRLMAELSEAGLMLNQYELSDKKSIQRVFSHTYYTTKKDGRHYVLIADQQAVNTIFEEVNQLDTDILGSAAMASTSMWFVLGSYTSYTDTEFALGNISNVALIQQNACIQLRPADISKWLSEETVCDVAMRSPQNDSNQCICKDSRKSKTVVEIFGWLKDNISFNCGNATHVDLMTALWTKEGRRFERVNLGEDENMTVSEDRVFPNSQYGLNNVSLIVTTLPWFPFVGKTDVNGTIEYTGLCMDLLHEMSRKLNFSYVITEPVDQEWGRVVKGKWTGLIGDIVYKRAHLIYAPISNQAQRMEVMDFTIPFYPEYNVIMMKKPDKDKTRWMKLLDPFHWLVIVTVCSLLPVITYILWICERFSPYLPDIHHRDRFRGLHHFSDCLCYMIGAMMTRCGLFLPKSHSGRTIVGCWWLFVIVIAALYTGNLMASLTVTKTKNPFNTINEMLKQSEYKWGTLDGTNLVMTLQNSKIREYQHIWDEIKRFQKTDTSVLSPNHTEHVQKVKAGGYAYIGDFTGLYLSTWDNCELVLADEKFFVLPYAIGLRKDSLFTEIFSDRLMLIRESGLLEMWKRKWWPKTGICQQRLLKTEARSIILLDVQSAFALILGGIVSSAIVFLAEIIYKRYR